jgi:hypothetical protein
MLALLAGCAKPAPSTDLVCVSDEGSSRVHAIDGATGQDLARPAARR